MLWVHLSIAAYSLVPCQYAVAVCCLSSQDTALSSCCQHDAELTTDVIAVQNGKTKFTIENATKTRIVIADTRIHILGSYQNIRVAR